MNWAAFKEDLGRSRPDTIAPFRGRSRLNYDYDYYYSPRNCARMTLAPHSFTFSTKVDLNLRDITLIDSTQGETRFVTHLYRLWWTKKRVFRVVRQILSYNCRTRIYFYIYSFSPHIWIVRTVTIIFRKKEKKQLVIIL